MSDVFFYVFRVLVGLLALAALTLGCIGLTVLIVGLIA
jgi:hypothetical protein